MSKTFAELGIPFPLFEGPAEQAVQHSGVDICSICKQKDQHCFMLGIGCTVMMDCPSCGAVNGLAADDRLDQPCLMCRSSVPFPEIADEEIKGCYTCLRAGKAAISQDTELGMISWEQALAGVTHGVPGLQRTDFELVDQGDGWFGARLPNEMMFELLRTPAYCSIQGERWQFCCKQPMIFIGEWTREEFTLRAPDGDGEAYFDSIVQDNVEGLWEDDLHDVTGVYVFRCAVCDRVTAHWDIA
jgi:uncharacterized protein CbrC (UPF0167 family)